MMKEKKKNHCLLFSENQDLELDCYMNTLFVGLWNEEIDQDPVCLMSRNCHEMILKDVQLTECQIYKMKLL